MKYIAKPNISIEVVINGPEANAGLNPNLSSIIGVKVPINEEIITTVNNENETINEILLLSGIKKLIPK
tara:strand:+ start:2827 stop:3033 length:207 start_codon:yes stop_codon:yes gene_type:complete